MMWSYKFRIYPNKSVEEKLEESLEISRWLYHRLLEEEISNARKEGKKITQKYTQTLIVKLKKDENTELKSVYSKALQKVNYQLWSNVKALSRLKKNGKKTGMLRYKKKGRYKSLNYNQSVLSIDPKSNRISLSEIGSVKAKIHREIEGKAKGIWVKKYPSSKWYAMIIQVQVEKQDTTQQTGNRVVGLDMGIEKFVVDSKKTAIENPKHLDKTIERIKLLQRKLSKKKKGSNNYYMIYVENLNIKGPVMKGKNKTPHQRILDASWEEFIGMRSYKTEGVGKTLTKVSPQYTSKKCVVCGEITTERKLSDRVFVCPECGWEADRDYNASLNILKIKTGVERPVAPVERKPLLRTIYYNKRSGFGASLLGEAGSPLLKRKG